MKRALIPLLLFLFPAVLLGQGNHIRTYRARIYAGSGAVLGTANSVTSTTYYDAAGRPVQTVRHGTTPSGKDLCDYTAYDAFGRRAQVWDFVPAGSSGGGFVTPDRIRSVTDCYHTDLEYDALGRTTRVTGANTPGNSAIHEYGYSPAGVRRYTAGEGCSVTNAGAYSGPLYSEAATDEDGIRLCVYKDAEGRTILERRGGTSSAPIDTYFVYDRFGSLACVLPPAAAEATSSPGSYAYNGCAALRRYAYFYRYDTRGNCIGRRLPGQDWAYTVYDGEGRPVLTQDPALRSKGQWRFMRYNALGQPTTEGVVKNGKSVDALVRELRDIAVTDTYSGEGLGYGHPAGLGTVVCIDRANYYGGYSFLSLPAFSGCEILPQSCAPHELSGQYQAILGDSAAYELSVLRYDYRGRVTARTALNTLCGTRETVQTAYNALDLPTSVKTVLQTGREICQLTETVTYDKAFRAKRSTLAVSVASPEHPVATGQNVRIFENLYDEYGRTVKESYSGGVIRSLSYRADGKLSQIASSGLTQHLYYDDCPNGTPLRNGRISEVATTQAGSTADFSIGYDAYGRYAGGRDISHPQCYETFAYDAMGNVTRMVQSSPEGTVNALTFTYDGNRLAAAHAIPGLPQNAEARKAHPAMAYHATTAGNAYGYDANGNETRHLAHSVSGSTYNRLNLPSHVTFTDRNTLQLKYTADGRRVETLSKIRLTPLVVPIDTTRLDTPDIPPITATSSQSSPLSLAGISAPGIPGTGIGGLTPDVTYRLHREWRIGSIVLEDSLITRIDIPHGFIRVERDSLGAFSLQCYRQLEDYLGSVRTTYRTGTGSAVAVQHVRYMPGGSVLGNTDENLQQRLFCGKELLPQHGWKVYDSHARMQCNVLPRFTSPDPLGEKYYHFSPYAYGADDPVNRIDNNGLEAGDVFDSLDDAALDFARIYNYFSIMPQKGYPYGREYTTFFYSFSDASNNIRYSYCTPTAQRASSATIKISKSLIPSTRRQNSDILAAGHTHGANDTFNEGNKFSKDDKKADKRFRTRFKTYEAGYLATTNGTFMKHWYDSKSDQWKIITFHGDKYQLPSDANDPTHGTYTITDIKEKYDDMPWLKRISISMSEFLERRLYK